jgi:MFS family permease
MANVKDRVSKGLSEVRTTILGVQIFLGFQYQAIFQTGFDALAPVSKALSIAAFALLLGAAGAMIAPVSYHQIAERGQATRGQDVFTRGAMSLALAPFAVAIGLNLFVALRTTWEAPAAIICAVLAFAAAILCWFGVELIMKRPSIPVPHADAKVDLKERISQMLTETRIVLPGVQALLGFQYAAYFTEPFKSLSSSGRAVHTASLFLLLASMILLMAPAPFHRIAENGEDTERACTVGVGLTLGGLALLGPALACDFYVAVLFVSGSERLSIALAAITGTALFVAWFGLPVIRRRTKPSS